MSLASLLQMLLDFSERAAAIARTIRSDETLFKLLVEEKTGAEKNQRFQQDFKTLADVLIQQALSYQIQNQFPDLSDRVYGEECAVFNNAVGESIIVKVYNTQHETASLLSKVLDGNTAAADVLAHEVHRRDIKSDLRIDADVVSVPLSQLAIWIDPIDSTAEYIRGNDCSSNSTGSAHLDMGKGSLDATSTSVCLSGLSCVTVLLGLFRYNDGVPVAGVVCQPFGEHSTDGGYRSRVWWGAASGSSNLRCDQALCRAPLSRVCVSSTEVPTVLAALINAGVEVVAAAGAGYKALLVITGHVQAYVCTKGSTYEWDSCGPHSILLSHGGGIVPYSSLAQFRHVPPPDTRHSQLRYTPRSEAGAAPHCNRGGLVAYHSHHHLLALAELLADVVLS